MITPKNIFKNLKILVKNAVFDKIAIFEMIAFSIFSNDVKRI